MNELYIDINKRIIYSSWVFLVYNINKKKYY